MSRFPDPLSGPHFTTDPQPISSKSTPEGWTELTFETPYGPLTSYYFPASNISPPPTGGIVILGGSSGLLHRPNEPYDTLSRRLAVEAGLPVLQAGYTRPNHLQANIPEAILGIHWLKKHAGVDKIITLGWSYGGAVAINAAASEPESVTGVVTIASQTYGAEEAAKKLKKEQKMILFHGTNDPVLSDACSKLLYESAGCERKELVLLEGGDHDLSEHLVELFEKTFVWCEELLSRV